MDIYQRGSEMRSPAGKQNNLRRLSAGRTREGVTTCRLSMNRRGPSSDLTSPPLVPERPRLAAFIPSVSSGVVGGLELPASASLMIASHPRETASPWALHQRNTVRSRGKNILSQSGTWASRNIPRRRRSSKTKQNDSIEIVSPRPAGSAEASTPKFLRPWWRATEARASLFIVERLISVYTTILYVLCCVLHCASTWEINGKCYLWSFLQPGPRPSRFVIGDACVRAHGRHQQYSVVSKCRSFNCL